MIFRFVVLVFFLSLTALSSQINGFSFNGLPQTEDISGKNGYKQDNPAAEKNSLFAGYTGNDAELVKSIPSGKENVSGGNEKVVTGQEGNFYLLSTALRQGEGYNIFVFKYDSAGNLLFSEEYNSSVNADDYLLAAIADKGGNLWIVTVNSLNTVTRIIFSDEGTLLNEQNLVPVSGLTRKEVVITRDSLVFAHFREDNVWPNRSVIRRYDIDGNFTDRDVPLPEKTLGSYMGRNSSGLPFLYYWTYGSYEPSDSVFVVQYGVDLNIEWIFREKLNNSDNPSAVSYSKNDILLTLDSGDGRKLIKIDSTGNRVWEFPTPGFLSPVAGNRYGEIFLNNRTYWTLLSPDGQKIWEKFITDSVQDILFDYPADGSVIFGKEIISRGGEIVFGVDNFLTWTGNVMVERGANSISLYSNAGDPVSEAEQNFPSFSLSSARNAFFDEYRNSYILNTLGELVKTDAAGNVLWIKEDFENPPYWAWFTRLRNNRNLLAYLDREKGRFNYTFFDDEGGIIRRGYYEVFSGGDYRGWFDAEPYYYNNLIAGTNSVYFSSGFTFIKESEYYYGFFILGLDYEGNLLGSFKESDKENHYIVRNITVDADNRCGVFIKTAAYREELQDEGYTVVLSWLPGNDPVVYPAPINDNFGKVFEYAGDRSGNFYFAWTDMTEDAKYRGSMIKMDGRGKTVYRLNSDFESAVSSVHNELDILEDNTVIWTMKYLDGRAAEVKRVEGNGKVLKKQYIDSGKFPYGNRQSLQIKPLDSENLLVYGTEYGVHLGLFNLSSGEWRAEKTETDPLGKAYDVMDVSLRYPGEILFLGNRDYTYDEAALIVFELEPLTEEASEIKENLTLSGNYPNPFNGRTTIKYNLKETGKVEIEIYNLLGQIVEKWNGVAAAGENFYPVENIKLGTGAYFYRVKFGEETRIGKMLLIK